MKTFGLYLLILFRLAASHSCTQGSEAPLPAGVKVAWNLESAFREKTPTQERLCLNGLWRWQPAKGAISDVPQGNWGFFKVPGCWPGIGDYMQTDSQTLISNPAWKDEKLANVTSAWYQREFSVPPEWEGRRIALSTEYLNSFAVVWVDGKRVGEISFPGGEVDLTQVCQPGKKYLLSLSVAALPLKGVLLSYVDTAAAREVKGAVNRRGLCGDVYLVATPLAASIGEIRVVTSVRNSEISVDATLNRLPIDSKFALRATIKDNGKVIKEFSSKPFSHGDLTESKITLKEAWKADKLWDIHTTQNLYEISVELLNADGKVLDASLPVRFGFREFWIDGRDFYLNGSRLFLSCVPYDNAHISAATATYDGARETFVRLKSFGINCVYTHNYDCEPGAHLSFEEILRAADDTGMLFSLTQPHFSHYEWKTPDADKKNGYARHAAFYTHVAANHPSVVFYSMSHNATGYNEDMNPDMIDGIKDPRENWSLNNSKLALRAEAIVKSIDPNRIVYHHASGNLGTIHNSNFYLNFTPIQEVSDWFEHWATEGVKPAFTCEYGVPFTWDWTLYRGWYKGQRNFGSAKVPWVFCFAEWNAQFLGDRAFELSPMEKKNLRWEAEQFRQGGIWFRWDYPYEIGSNVFDDRNAVMARYTTDNWRAFRTWGLSGNSPWEFGHFWRLRDGVKKGRREIPVDWEKLQRPGYSPDYIDQRYERMDVSYAKEDWVPTAAATALIRNNLPLLAYIAGKSSRFTSREHNFLAGETIEKQLIVINNSRETVKGNCAWSLNLPQSVKGVQEVSVAPGEQARIPLRFVLPEGIPAGNYELMASVRFSIGEEQTDKFQLQVLASTPPQKAPFVKVALFDPKGDTAKLLERLEVPFESVQPSADLSAFKILAIGKGALSLDGPVPDVSRVREGMRVVVFEQTSEVLEKRFGFRVAEYGLRQLFKRVPNHPLLDGLDTETLRDWRGEATLLASRLKYELSPRFNGAPTVRWCDIEVTRAWRCGNRGNVSSVLIEKPACGDCLPILDGGFSLQYSPLLECRDGKGIMLFCQVDVCGRTETEPAADQLVRNIFSHASTWEPMPQRKALYVGDIRGKSYFEKTGVVLGAYEGGPIPENSTLIAGPGSGEKLASHVEAIHSFIKAGGTVLVLGLSDNEANSFLPFKIVTKKSEHISAYFTAPTRESFACGIGPADIHNRDVKDIALITGGATVIGDGVLAIGEGSHVVFCQTPPWSFDYSKQYNVKRTYRRVAFLLTRLLANMGVAADVPLAKRINSPVDPAKNEKRWLAGLYLDEPEEMDDPYRFFRW